jgi:hypothetical protein
MVRRALAALRLCRETHPKELTRQRARSLSVSDLNRDGEFHQA